MEVILPPPSMRPIVVTGAGGQLGQEFQKLASRYPFTFKFLGRKDFDITAVTSRQIIDSINPAAVINCAAYTAVDKAEEEKAQAMRVNAIAVQQLGRVCEALDIPIIHFSSDYVYHNSLRRPLEESDPVRPKGVYAKSKLKGEKLLVESHSYPLIFRVSWLYSTFGHNFPKTMLRLGDERSELTVVRDQIGAPTYAEDLADAVLKILEKHLVRQTLRNIQGIYNFSNTGITSWAGIADRVMKTAELSCKIIPIRSVEYPTPARRPRYSKLSLAKFKKIFEIPLQPWEDRLDDCIRTLLNES